MKIIFVHGWGADASYWDNLAPLVKGGEDAQRVDLGFTNKPAYQPQEDALYITHSLGTLWALKHRHKNMRGLVAMNGFACFKSFTPPRILKMMQTGLAKDLVSQMHAFFIAACMPQQDDLNPNALHEGLEWLVQHDTRPTLAELECPIMALLSGEDKIIPIGAAQEQWADFDTHVCADGDHNIPQNRAQWCADHINAYIQEHMT
jgi:pimeloyl-[acyl-carrier protein] methyl ester esterase